ncbi:MAG: GAF domain-containing sensor histidine kinase [Candidatus Nanopelagicales bacterium]
MGFLLAGLTVVAVLAVAATLFVQQRRRSGEEYRSAHRLLTRLQSISRQLPAGLDEVALAQQTLEQIAKDVGARRSVLFLNQDDRFVPYAVAGSDRSPFDALPDVVVEAAREGRPLAGRDLISEAALQEATVPLTLGMRLVGIVALQSDQPFDYALLKQSVERGHDAALRIDSGRLFSDVRQAATVEERRRLAREIHDGVAQELASVGYALDALVSDLDGSQDRALADEIRSEVRRIVSELRLSIFDLRADIQPGVGLGSALTSYVQQAGTAAGLTVHLVIDESRQRLPVAQETELLRIAQEAVTNVRRHAAADNLWVTYKVDPPGAFLSVTDDGQGMDSPRNDSFGLDIMQERAHRIGAQLSWRPRDGGGTVLEVALQPPAGEREE